MPNCDSCDGRIDNSNTTRMRISKGMLEPRSSYCGDCKKIKLITPSSKGTYGYPIWCPRNAYNGTCIECGTRIRIEEGEYCRTCRNKQ